MRKYIFRCRLSLGDILLLTAAVRDLHLHLPGRFITDVRTSFPELWQFNPHLTPLAEYDPDVRVLECEMPLINQSQEAGCHSVHCFVDFLNRFLGTNMQPTAFRGDLHLSRREKASPSLVQTLTGSALPFWLISAGGKYDCTVKWWDAQRYQEVVDCFRDRIQFVQVGDLAHYHPKLRGVIDLRGRTSVRELVRLCYHSAGVLCGVTGLMHLAPAVPVRAGGSSLRPCVVVGGGREPPHWVAYPGHQFVHTVGALHCCAAGGCWKSRTEPLRDGDERDNPEHLCVDVRGGRPRCMDLISSAEVCRRIEGYFTGGVARYLSRTEARAARAAVVRLAGQDVPPKPLNFYTAPELAEQFANTIPAYPAGYTGQGIVICGGRAQYFANTWVCINLLRRFGCALPIQLWHLGKAELDARMAALVAPLGVECVDALEVQKEHPVHFGHPWALKPYAILHSRFKEVLLLDADNMPVANPDFLFRTPQFRRTGAVFWPDCWRTEREATAWKLFGVPYLDEPQFETGQILVNKEVCWRPLNLCLWYHEHSELFYRHVYGDKETFHLAFRKLDAPYAMPRRPIHRLRGVMCQHDFAGHRLFQHRNLAKWNFFGPNRRICGFRFEPECRQYLRQLAKLWDGQIAALCPPPPKPAAGPRGQKIAAQEIKIAACMVTCAERDTVRGKTLANLACTDWARRPVHLQLDEKHFTRTEDNITHTGWRAIQAGLQTEADYILYLEDDLDFNRHFLHNLMAWPLLQRRQISLATLFNQGLSEYTRIPQSHAIVIDPRALVGAQALLLSRRTARFLLDHWSEGPAPVDLRIAALAARLDRPAFCHWPSLVRHLGRQSLVGSPFRQACDFQRHWRAPTGDGPALAVVEVPDQDHQP